MSSETTTVLDSLRANADKHPDKLLYAFLDAKGRTTESYDYGTFVQRTGDIASHFHGTYPLQPGERVLLVYPPGLEMICALFACARLGLIPVPVYPPSSHGFAAALYKMNFIAQDCGAAVVLTDRSYSWSLKLHRARTKITALSLKRDYTSKLKWIVTDDAESNGPQRFLEAHSEVFFLQYTSGSTSDPKGVMVTHDNILNNSKAVVDHRPISVSWLPQYHDMGLIAFYFFMPIEGGTTYGFSPLDFIRRPALWFEAISQHGATASAAPSFAYEYCLRPDKVEEGCLEHLDLSSLRVLLNGAEPVKAEVFRQFLERYEPYGLKPGSFSTAYGLAEFTLAVTGRGRTIRSLDAGQLTKNLVSGAQTPSQAGGTKALVSCGKPLGSTEIKIVDVTESAKEVSEGRVGEIWVAGPSKCLGYWNRPELSEEVFEARLDGEGDPDRSWLRTGDLGFVKDGELFVSGRAKDVIIVRGANYYPQDVEAIVEKDRAVRRGCVAAFAAEKPGWEGVVVVAEIKRKGQRPDVEKIHRNIRRDLGIVVDEFLFIPKRTIPKTTSGKISRHRAHAQWCEEGFKTIHKVQTTELSQGEAGSESRPPAWDTDGELADLEHVFRKHGLTGAEDVTLLETGLDSLGLVNFAVDIEKYLEKRGASDLAAGIQVRWLQAIPISELFELVGLVTRGAPSAKVRFRKAFAGLRREHQELEKEMMRRDSGLGHSASPTPPVNHEGMLSPGGVLLTGGTGFFGPFLLRSLLQQCDDPIHVLVRARDVDHGRQRLAEGLASLGLPIKGSNIEDWRSRVFPICGDLSRPRLGLSASQWTFLSENVRAVYNNGASVNYLMDYSSMRDANVGATREVIRLATTAQAKVLNHISTTFVFGWSTHETLFESDANEGMELLDFGYSQSKWVSEQLVLNAMQSGLTARVFRPALIAPSAQGGGHNFDIAIRLFAFMLDHGISTSAKNQVSLTPADVAANNIVAISHLANTVGQTFHVTRDDFSSLLDITGVLGDLTQTRFENLPIQEFVPSMIERCQKGDLLFPLVNFLAHSVDNITAMEFKRYDNQNYQLARAQSPVGIPDPPLEDVVEGIVRFMLRHGIIKDRKAELALAKL